MSGIRQKSKEDAFRLINYPNREIDYIVEYRDYLNKINFSGTELSYWDIITSYCFRQIDRGIQTKSRNIEKPDFSLNKFKKSMKKFVDTFNIKNSKKNLYMPKALKVNDSYFAFFLIINPSHIQQSWKTSPSPKNVEDYFCIFLKPNKIYYYKGKDYIRGWLNWWLISKLKIRFEDFKLQQYKVNDFLEFLSHEDVKLYEIGFSNTEVSIGDKIVVKSRKGEGIKYYNKLKEGDLIKKNPSIYDIDYVKFTYKKSKIERLNLRRKKGFYKAFQTNALVENLPDSLKNYVKENVLLYDEVNPKHIIRQLILKQYTDKYDYKNPYVKETLDELEKAKITSINEFYNYWCMKPGCEFSYDKKPMQQKTCQCGTISSNKFVSRYDIRIDYDKIITRIGKGLQNYGCRYNKLPESYLGFKNATVLRIKQHNRYLYVLINRKGLADEEINTLKTNGIPMVIINLKGELKSTLKDFNMLDAGDFIYSLIDDDHSELKYMIDHMNEKAFSLKYESFKTAISNLEKASVTATSFENSVFSVFNFIFPETQKWGGPRLADGSFPFRAKKIQYAMWDAKRYDKSSLSDYVKQKALSKDVKYMEKFNQNKLIRNFGALKFYIFVTSNTSEEEFSSLRDTMKKQIKKIKTTKRLTRVAISCMNKDELVKLGKFVEGIHLKLMQEYNSFLKILKRGFIENNGYFKFDSIKDDIEDLVKDVEILPQAKELRKTSIKAILHK